MKNKKRNKSGESTPSPRKIRENEKKSALYGIYRSSPRSYGFIAAENGAGGRESDIIVYDEQNLAGAIDGDRVAYKTVKSTLTKTGVEGIVTGIEEHKHRSLICVISLRNGIYTANAGKRYGDIKIEIKPENLNGAVNDDIAAVEILHEKTKRRSAKYLKAKRRTGEKTETKPRVFGQVAAVFGSKYDVTANYNAILAEFNIPRTFAPELTEEADLIRETGMSVLKKVSKKREDLRGKPVLTIDGETAKDLDDAVSIEIDRDKNYVLGVHIADVSNYIKPGSPLDLEAYSRGTSVYFADSVAPMFPAPVSNGICSLTPGEDKLCLSAFMTIGKNGRLISSRFSETVINSRVKGIYSELNALFDEFDGKTIPENKSAAAALKKKYKGLLAVLKSMRKLAVILKKSRDKRGALELSSTESVFAVTREGGGFEIESISPFTAGESENLIEEFMIKANEAVAGFLTANNLPCLYRVHEPPFAEKMEVFFENLKRVGYRGLKKNNYAEISPHDLQRVLKFYRDGDLYQTINIQLLRSLAKARYSADNVGHFGLASPEYCHFTSPIRRYPDLLVHRILKAALESGGARDKITSAKFASFIRTAAVKSTEREINAVSAERKIADFLRCVYMKEHIGEEYDGVISSVTSFGVFVALENTCEGLIKSYLLGDDLFFDRSALELRSDSGGEPYRIGRKIRIKVASVSIETLQTDFIPVVLQAGTEKTTEGDIRGR